MNTIQVLGGRRSGKTTILAQYISKALEAGQTVGIVGPNLNIERMLNEVIGNLSNKEGRLIFVRSYHQIYNLDLLAIEELGYIEDEEAVDLLRTVLQLNKKLIFSMTIDSENNLSDEVAKLVESCIMRADQKELVAKLTNR